MYICEYNSWITSSIIIKIVNATATTKQTESTWLVHSIYWLWIGAAAAWIFKSISMYTPIDPVFFFSFDFTNLKRIRSFSNVELIWLTLTGHMRLSLRMITCVKLKSLRAKQFGCFFTIKSTNRTQIECKARDYGPKCEAKDYGPKCESKDYGPKCDGIQLRQENTICV